MGEIGTALTLLDWKKRLDPNGNAPESKIVELLAEKNEMLEDMLFVEGNLPTGHRTTVRTGIPAATWRKLNYGVIPTKSTTKQVDDACGMLETYSEVDKDLAELNGTSNEFLLSEAKPCLEGMNQSLQTGLLYGDSSIDPEKIMGLTPRFSDAVNAGNKAQIIDGGGSSNLTSIYLIGWGADSVHGIFPKASKAGIIFENLGQQTKSDGNSGLYQVLRSHYQWKVGLTVRDSRYIVRIANIDYKALTHDAATGADLIDKMTEALEQLQDFGGKTAFYVPRVVRSFLRRQINAKTANQLTFDTVAGKRVLSFGEVPVRRVDKFSLAETQVSFS